ncbi:MAG: Phage terminase, small subunit [Solirubrobacterales bacterium]|nr:Phage terminase, small subunit [Solirubrobacterales bacterium]
MPPAATYDAILAAIEHESVPEADRYAIQRFCDLLDERAELRAVLDVDGPILREPVVSPTGAVVGERVVAHPALAALRAIDRAIEAVSASLGLSPAARRKMRAADGALADLWRE